MDGCCVKKWLVNGYVILSFLISNIFVFSLTFERSKLVVSIRKSEIMTNEEKDWKSKKLAIEVGINRI